LKHSDRIFIAYEPIWAIGSGVTPTVDEIIEVHKHIRLTMQELYPKNSSSQVSILYGASVQLENAYALLREPMIEGLLVGGASLKIHEMKPIVDAACEVLTAQSQS
ncbi:MAG: triose-phosphate isomerase family protein, partial [Patescibacteria group bacterium]